MCAFSFAQRPSRATNSHGPRKPLRSRLKASLSRLYDRVFWVRSRAELNSFILYNRDPSSYHSCERRHLGVVPDIHDDARSDSEASTLPYDNAAYEGRALSDTESLMKPLLG